MQRDFQHFTSQLKGRKKNGSSLYRDFVNWIPDTSALNSAGFWSDAFCLSSQNIFVASFLFFFNPNMFHQHLGTFIKWKSPEKLKIYLKWHIFSQQNPNKHKIQYFLTKNTLLFSLLFPIYFVKHLIIYSLLFTRLPNQDVYPIINSNS